MAPEILLSNEENIVFTEKADVWSLGIILYEMMYNKHPFNFDFMKYVQKMERIIVSNSDPLADDFVD